MDTKQQSNEKSNKSTKQSDHNFKLAAEEFSLTAVVLGFIIAGLLGGAQLTGHIQLPTEVQRAMGGALIAYVIVGTMLAVHFGIKFITRK